MLTFLIVVLVCLASVKQVTLGEPPDLTVFEPEVDGLTVTVNGVVFAGTPGTTVERIHWNWNDGYEEDHWFAASHTYAGSGIYTITITAYQSDGLTSTEIRQVTLGKPPGPTILVLVNEDIYIDINTKLVLFERDLRNEGYEVLNVTVSSETSPPEIKEIIKSYYLQYDLDGTILVGDIKAAYCEIHTGDFSDPEAIKIWISLDAADMYYMDLDGYWEHVENPDFCEDAPPNVVECHLYPSCETFKNEYMVYLDEDKEWDYGEIENKVQYKAEIWVSRIMAHNLKIPGKTEVQIINDFLDWNHDYRNGNLKVSSKAYMLAAWREDAPCPYQCMDYSTIFDKVVMQDNIKKEDFLTYLEDPEGSRLLYLGAHSWPQGHALYDESTTTDELLENNKTSTFYILNACSSCRWDQGISSPTDPNYLGGLYVFDTSPDCENYGLAAIGFTGVGGFNWLEYLTDYLNLNPNSNYGEAYMYWFNKNLMHIFGIWNYVYLGDPTIGPEIRLKTDLNNDGTVNIQDLFTVAKAFGSHGPDIPNPGEPASKKWNPIADVTRDGWINIQDLFKVARDYGKTV